MDQKRDFTLWLAFGEAKLNVVLNRGKYLTLQCTEFQISAFFFSAHKNELIVQKSPLLL